MRRIEKLGSIGLLAGLLLVGPSAGSGLAQGPPVLIGPKAAWRYSAGPSRPPEGWKLASFDDRGWKSGRAGFGYGDSDDSTVLEDMRDRYTAVFLRNEFDPGPLDDVGSLYLSVNYDDGFIAYLNGEEVASASITRVEGGLRVDQHEATGPELFVIRDARSLLKPGRNILAIEGHNVSPDSSDFSLDPTLATREVGGLVPADYLADVEELGRRLLDQSSYLDRLGFDHSRALADLRRSIGDRTSPARFALGVRELVMQIGDCHADVRPPAGPESAGFLPIRLADTLDGIAALDPVEDRPVDPTCPYLESIDGEPIDRWLGAASRLAPRGSPQLIRRRSLEWLGDPATLREELGRPPAEAATVGLRSRDGRTHASRSLRLTRHASGLATARSGPTRRLDGGIGYLRIPSMDDRLIDPTVAAIRSFREARGLIIDVRDNSGGTYGLLRATSGFFEPAGAEPRITNIAAYRLGADFARDHIEYRPTYRADWDGWDDRERAAIRRAAAAFRPEWTLPPGRFSDWHYMILDRRQGGLGDAPADFHFSRPVVVLANAGSFSATDGFLNAFAELPQVTIVGEPSGGGSGASRSFLLPRSRVEVTLSSMASFRPDGRLFDGRGIEVDIPIKPTLDDFTTDVDSVLARGVRVILERSADPQPGRTLP